MLIRLRGSYGGCADIGTLAAGFIVLLLLAFGDVSLVVHFLVYVSVFGLATARRFSYFLRLLSETVHSTSSSLQLVHGAPCSTTLHRTLRDLQHWQAFDARLLTLFGGRMPLGLSPASEAVRF